MLERRDASGFVSGGKDGRPDNVIQFAPAERRAAFTEIADLDFEAVPEFVNFPNSGERAEAHEDKLKKFAIASRWAIAILGQSKSKLVEIVTELDVTDPRHADNLLRDLMAAREFADSLHGMVAMAAHRLGVAISNNLTRT